MADSLTVTPGTLTIADRVGEKIAVRSALAVDDVIARRSSISSALRGAARLGGDLPQAAISMDQPAPTVRISIAVRWPSPIAEVCDRVRTHVADELDRLTGVRPGRVDVTVAQVVSHSDAPSKSRVDAPSGNGFTELKAAEQ